MKLLAALLIFSSMSYAQTQSMYLSKDDQKYFKNDQMDGNNQRERIDANVKEINRLHGEISMLKAEVSTLKKDIEELKKGK